MTSARSIVIYAFAMISMFGISFGIGYVYQYDPERDVVELVINRTADVSTGGSELIAGIVRDVNLGSVTIETDSGTIEVSLDELTLEGLVHLDDPASIAAGTTVNLGGERILTERVITGLVFFDGETQQ
jgi:hypothetical protein